MAKFSICLVVWFSERLRCSLPCDWSATSSISLRFVKMILTSEPSLVGGSGGKQGTFVIVPEMSSEHKTLSTDRDDQHNKKMLNIKQALQKFMRAK